MILYEYNWTSFPRFGGQRSKKMTIYEFDWTGFPRTSLQEIGILKPRKQLLGTVFAKAYKKPLIADASKTASHIFEVMSVQDADKKPLKIELENGFSIQVERYISGAYIDRLELSLRTAVDSWSFQIIDWKDASVPRIREALRNLAYGQRYYRIEIYAEYKSSKDHQITARVYVADDRYLNQHMVGTCLLAKTANDYMRFCRKAENILISDLIGDRLEAGSRVNTPRFCTVRLEEVYETQTEAWLAGYKEPTYYSDPEYEVVGKSLDMYHMQFAAYRKKIS